MHFFTFYVQELSQVGLGPTTDCLDLSLGEWVQHWLGVCVDVVDEEVLACILDVVDLALEDQRVGQISQPCWRERERVAALPDLTFLEVLLMTRGPSVSLLGTFGNPATVAVVVGETEASAPLDTLWVEFSQTILDVDTFLGWMATNLVQDAGQGLLSEADLELLCLDLRSDERVLVHVRDALLIVILGVLKSCHDLDLPLVRLDHRECLIGVL